MYHKTSFGLSGTQEHIRIRQVAPVSVVDPPFPANAHKAQSLQSQTRKISMPTSGDERGAADVRAFFQGLQSGVRGQIMVEALEPHFVTSVDGAAARILQTSSSRVIGRRAKGITERAEEQTRLGEALRRAQATYHCVDLIITSAAGRRVHVFAQRRGTGNLIEVGLFPAEASYTLLSQEPVVDRRDHPAPQELSQGNLSFNELRLDDLHDGTEGLEDAILVALGNAAELARKVAR